MSATEKDTAAVRALFERLTDALTADDDEQDDDPQCHPFYD